MFHRSTKAVVQGRHILRRTTKNIPENSRSRRWPLLLGLGAAALLLVLAGLALFWYREDTAPALEGRQLLAIPAEASLAQETDPGDVLRIYAGQAEIPTLRYVQVGAVAGDSISVLLSEPQLQDYLEAAASETVYAALVIHNDAQAAQEALELQDAWNNPDISIGLPDGDLTLELDESAQLAADISISPEGAVAPEITWSSSDETVATVDDSGMVTALSPGKTELSVSCGESSAACTVMVFLAASELEFDSDEITIGVGGNVTLTPTVSPENYTETLRWSTADSSVAEVDSSGAVTGIAEGEAEITVSGKHVSASYTVVVVTEAEEIRLNRETLLLEVGRSGALAAVVTPEDTSDKTVSWTSSDEAVATVDAEGTITAITEGEAEITASCGAVSASCTVTVIAPAG